MVPTLSPADPDPVHNRNIQYPPYYFPHQQPPMDYRTQAPPQDYYNGRGPPTHQNFPPPYHGHPHQGWPGHPPPGSMMPHQSPPLDKFPQGNSPSHPHQVSNQYVSHTNSPPIRSHSNSFNPNLDPNIDHRRGTG
jgi:hypothetical protein